VSESRIGRRPFLKGAAATVTAGLTIGTQASDGRAAAARRGYRLIPCEEAFTLPEILAEARRVANNVPSMASGPIVGPLVPLLLDLGADRLARMDAAGVDMQVLSLGSPGVQNFDRATAVSLAALANDRLADVVKSHPTRYAGLATFAPQDPAAAAKELDRAVRKLGLKGALVNSHTGSSYLDEPQYRPIFEALQALDVPLYIHPREPGRTLGGPALTMPGFTIGWGYGVETGTHALRLIGSGLFDDFPRLKIVLGHMGETIPFVLQRIDDRYRFERSLFPGGSLQRLPGDYFRENFWVTTSGMNFAAPLQATIATLGIDRVLFAIDYPFEDQAAAVRAFDSIPLPADAKRRICETNVANLFAL
jgi:2,3-dihydroxybenzoate decarboxylase